MPWVPLLTFDVFVPIVTVIIALVLYDGYRAFMRTRARLRRAATERSVEDRLLELSKSMQDSARLMSEVTAELDARTITAKKLQDDAATAKAAAEINREQANAIRRMLDSELSNAARAIRTDSIRIGIASFIAGGGVSFLITLLVHPMH
jgi:hypothetical protein